MDLLLVLEHHFYRDDQGNVWCDRVIDREFTQRYLKVFDDVTICARVSNIKVINPNYKKVSGYNTRLLRLPDFKGLKGLLLNLFKIIIIFKNNYKNFETVIFRAPSPLSLLLYRFTLGKIKV